MNNENNFSDVSSPFESTTWYKPGQDSSTNYRHPFLYCAAVYALLLIIIGTIGNILTIIILLRPNLRKYSTMRYLTAVAMADLFALYSWDLNLFYKHLINPYQNDLEDSSIIVCRIISFMAFVSLQLSSWYLTLVSVDRCLNLYFLSWNQKLGRINYVVYIILSVAITVVLINGHLLFLNGYKQPDCIPFEKRTCFICYARLNDKHYIFPKWERIHIVIYNLIPFSIMLVSNSFIIRRTVLATMHRTQSTNFSGKSGKTYRQRKQRQITCLLLFVTFLFVFLTTPVMIYEVFLRNYMINKKPLKYILQATLLCIQYTSHAINFFIYCFGASNFRHELKKFLTNCITKKNDDINLSRFSSVRESTRIS